MGKKKSYLASSNTSSGFVSYFDYVLRDAERVYIIKGGPGCGKSTFMKKVGEALLEDGFSVDFVYCSADRDSLDALVIHDIKFVIVDGTAPHVIDPKYPGAVETILNFGDFWDVNILRDNKDTIKVNLDEMAKEYTKLFEHFKNAKLIHDRWEKEYLIGMDFLKADKITRELIEEVITGKLEKEGKEWHRFSGAATPQGNINFYEELTDGIKNRYIVKGRPGSGKSTMTKKVAKAALNAGYDVEYYHCAFDSNSIDLIVIPELSFAMLDGTAPHVMDPGPNDKLIDMFTTIDTNIVHEEQDPIKSIEIEYAEEIYKAREVYKRIKELHDCVEEIYVKATDFDGVNELTERVIEELKSMK